MHHGIDKGYTAGAHQNLEGKKPIAGATRHMRITMKKKASLIASAWRPLAPAAIAVAPAVGFMNKGAESWMVPANACLNVLNLQQRTARL